MPDFSSVMEDVVESGVRAVSVAETAGPGMVVASTRAVLILHPHQNQRFAIV